MYSVLINNKYYRGACENTVELFFYSNIDNIEQYCALKVSKRAISNLRTYKYQRFFQFARRAERNERTVADRVNYIAVNE